MKRMLNVLLKTLGIAAATVAAILVLEIVMTPFIDIKGVKFIVKVAADVLMAVIPLSLYLFVYKEPARSLGLADTDKLRRLAIGAALGFLSMLVLFVLVLGLGGVKLAGFSPDYAANKLLYLVVTSFTVSFGEEILFRGAIQGVCRNTYGRWAGIAAASCFFFLLHGANPGIFQSPIAPVSLLLAGFLVSLLREYTGSLWLPIGFHWTWNMFQDLFGFATSGFASEHSPFRMTVVEGKEWLNGGSFGLEGSIVTVFVLLAAAIYVSRRMAPPIERAK